MASNASVPTWTWSAPHGDYYYVTYDASGNPHYIWSKEASQPASQAVPAIDEVSRTTTQPHAQQLYSQQAYGQQAYPQPAYQQQAYPQPAYQQQTYSQQLVNPAAGQSATQGAAQSYQSSETVTDEEQARVGNYIFPKRLSRRGISTGDGEGKGIAGSYGLPAQPPQYQIERPILSRRGLTESLDPDYTVRAHADQFFRKGRVIAILFSDTTERPVDPRDSNISLVKYGEAVYTQIRRFVIVDEKHGFCHACPILTYGRRGTTKPGCRPKEHAIIYTSGQAHPLLLEGEHKLTKRPIALMPADGTEILNEASRIWFGKVYPIEWNVKVKDLGRVANEDMDLLLSYYAEEIGSELAE